MPEQPKSVTIALDDLWLSTWREVLVILKSIERNYGSDLLGEIRAQIEAQLPKPKPEEPKEPWSVVKTGAGVVFVRWDMENDPGDRWLDAAGGWYTWDEIARGDVEIIR